jgi:hypothetical protein
MRGHPLLSIVQLLFCIALLSKDVMEVTRQLLIGEMTQRYSRRIPVF